MTVVRFQGIYLIYISRGYRHSYYSLLLKNYLQNNGLGIEYKCFKQFRTLRAAIDPYFLHRLWVFRVKMEYFFLGGAVGSY